MGSIRSRIALRSRISKYLSIYRQGGGSNIAIFALRRGGSTLLADMLGAERGIRMVNEPFLVLEASPDYAVSRRWLRPRLHSEFFDLDERDREEVRAYMTALLAGKVPLGVCRFPKFPLRADRMLLKILHATALVDWLSESFDLQAIRLLRHPASQALSVLRAGWDFEVEAYYTRPEFLLDFLDEEQVEYCHRILGGTSRWRMAILDYCIKYRLLVHVSRVPSPLVTYEELALDPAAVCRVLCDRFGLADFDRIAGRARQPSTSPGGCSKETLSLLESGDSGSLIRGWQSRVDEAMAGEAQEILDRFGVSIYNMRSPLPDRRRAEFLDDRGGLAAASGRRATSSPSEETATVG